MDYVTETGLVVTDRRHLRAADDGRLPPRDNPPNSNDPPLGTVGPNTDGGFGDTHVMYPAAIPPPQVQAWDGWPVEWATPTWGSYLGLDVMQSRSTIVAACIDLNAGVLASMPVYTTKGSTPQPKPSWAYNPQPEVYASWDEFFKQVVTSYEAAGEVILWATSRFADNFPSRFVMLNPIWVNIEFVGGERRYELGGLDITDDVLHIRYSSWPGDARGHGPLESALNNLCSVEAIDRYMTNLARRGGIPWAVLTHPGNLQKAQAETLQMNFVNAKLSALGAPAVLSGGVTLKELSMSPKDMALLELKSSSEARLAVLLGVPPTLVGLPIDMGSMQYANITSFFDFHWRAYLRPKAHAITAAMSGWLLPRGSDLELNRDEYTRPDFKDRAEAYKVLHDIVDSDGTRALYVPEIRALERLSPATDDIGAANELSGAASA